MCFRHCVGVAALGYVRKAKAQIIIVVTPFLKGVCSEPLKRQSQLKQTTICSLFFFFFFFRKIVLTFHVNRLLGKRFTWNAKTFFLWKIKKRVLNVVCYKFCLALLGLKKEFTPIVILIERRWWNVGMHSWRPRCLSWMRVRLMVRR